MFHPVAELGSEIAPVVQGVHLMDAETGEPVGVACEVRSHGVFDRVEHRGRLTVRERNDDPGVGVEQVDDVGRLIRCVTHAAQRYRPAGGET